MYIFESVILAPAMTPVYIVRVMFLKVDYYYYSVLFANTAHILVARQSSGVTL